MIEGALKFHIIAHRLSTIMNADKIVVVESGKVVEQGSHQQLLQNQGAYYQLWVSQYAVNSTSEIATSLDLYQVNANGYYACATPKTI
ncbi:MAG: hypothetical protein EAZ22_00220 [Cytophagales bacterium]|nr:MAG: hypothetical protein EAZ22_00220 [Cytophagales bacterium]